MDAWTVVFRRPGSEWARVPATAKPEAARIATALRQRQWHAEVRPLDLVSTETPIAAQAA